MNRVIPLYRHAQPAQTGVDDDVRNIIGLLETNEWAEHCTETVLGSRLEAEITRLVGSAQPAPVVPENCVTAEHRRVIEMLLNVCGAAFELADDSCQQDVDGGDCHVVPDDSFQKLSDALDEIENTLPTEDIDRPSVFLAWSAMPRAALKSILQAGNPPVIPDGYVMVPMRLTAENGAKGALSGEFSETKFVNCPECFGDDECETCDGSGRIEITVPVTWTTIKEIWAKGVEHFSATPREVKGE
nr:molecular chaperone DnaJ [Klebsiella pneumoniae]